MTQKTIHVSATHLSKSPSNVRRSSDVDADAQLEANIAAHGILQNLIAVPVARKKGHYRVTAGGRRLDAVHRLIEKGELPADYAVPVIVVPEANAIELSLAENWFRLAMNPADACRAFQDIIETEGKTSADVARRFGLTERFVLGRLRLAGLAEPIFEALGQGEISLDVAMAYASVDDTARQASVFEELARSYNRDNVHEIRRRLAVGGCRGDDPRALLVGRDAYVEAGGLIDRDLFADEDSETWASPDVLDALVRERLEQAAEEIRTREGFAEVRSIPQSHLPYVATMELKPLYGDTHVTPENIARQDQIEAEIDEIEGDAEQAEELTPEQSKRLDALDAELEALRNPVPIFTDEQKGRAIAFLVVDHDGSPRLHSQFYADPEPVVVDEEGGADEGDDASAPSTVPVEPASRPPSHRLLEQCAVMKTEILAARIAGEPAFARDLIAFMLAECAASPYGPIDLPADFRASRASHGCIGFESGSSAAAAWADSEASLDRSWLEHEEVDDRYDAFCALDEASRDAWAAFAIARTFQPMKARPVSPLAEHLAEKLGVDVAACWRPTAGNYFDHVPKAVILDAIEEVGGRPLRANYDGLRKADLAKSAEALFGGQTIIEADIKAKALAWVPDLMRIGPDEEPIEPDAPATQPLPWEDQEVVPVPTDDADQGATETEAVLLDQAA